MATSISIKVGSITDTSIAITMRVNVTYKGTYKIKYGNVAQQVVAIGC